ncbi:MAG TPA: c-type cytochrome, partial [Agitococcus sp.]|nr:c-type cytochrome [Agitococcus sp.]HMV60922.1 c-type cytochrome [Agitococcus sp.]HMY00582.1 c-type cytochrome [Agitococcus sp.]HNN29403.1 c-type cytochrome [Agitococcus sp.]
ECEMKKVMLLVASLGLLASQASFAAPDRKGEDVYKAVCAMCHGAGVAGAPKFGDKAAWKARIAQGTPVLYDHALKGIRAMPAKGTCATCTEKEIKNAVDYMVSKAK